MGYFFIAIILFSLLLSKNYKTIYQGVRAQAIQQLDELKFESAEVPCYSTLAIFMFLVPVFFFWITSDLFFSSYMFFLAIIAYSDLVTRWIPDVLIYILVFISAVSINHSDYAICLASVVFFVLPVVLLNFYGYLKTRHFWVASGDFYVLPTVAVWIQPEYAAALIMIVLLTALLVSKLVKGVPLVTCIYIAFIGYKVCEIFGIL